MKAISIILFLLFNSACFAQVKGQYYELPELKKVEGTWIGSSDGSDSLIFEIKSSKEFLKGVDVYMDILIGRYLYFKNNVLIDSNSIRGNIKSDSNIILAFVFAENVKQKLGDLNLELSSLQSKEARWILKNREGVYLLREDGRNLDGSMHHNDFSVPTKIVLKKN